jgi:hypothetical protein
MFDEKIAVNTKLKIARISLRARIKDVTRECGITQNALYHLEKAELENNALVKYLKYFRSKGIDLNKFFEDGK